MVRSSGDTPASPGPAASSTTSMSARVGPFLQPNNARAMRAKKPSLSPAIGRGTGTGRLRCSFGAPAGSAGRPGASDSGMVLFSCGGARRVRVGHREAPENPALQAFHLFGVAVVLVVIAEQMQKSVDGEVGKMVAERLALGGRFAGGRLIGDDDVTDIWGRPGGFSALCAWLAGAAGNDSTLVAAFLPRQSRLSALIAESLPSTIASSARGVEAAFAAAKTALRTTDWAVRRFRQSAERTTISILTGSRFRLRGRAGAADSALCGRNLWPQSLAPRRRAASALS